VVEAEELRPEHVVAEAMDRATRTLDVNEVLDVVTQHVREHHLSSFVVRRSRAVLRIC
jgi:hypothetical protein